MRILTLVAAIGTVTFATPLHSTSVEPSHSTVRAYGGRPDTLHADLASSLVRWKGTKFRGRGSHSGTLRLSAGEIVLQHGAVRGGSFHVDMRSLEVTDIPVTDPVPRNKLRRHLAGSDFFDVERWPTARFRATGSTRTGESTYRLTGLLLMRGVERPMTLDVTVKSFENATLVADARVVFDRHLWGLDYKGGILTNDLLDDDVTLDVRLVARRVAPRMAVRGHRRWG